MDCDADDTVNCVPKFLINNNVIAFNENAFTANALNTNDDFALHYIERAVREGYLEQFNISSTTAISTLDISRISNDSVTTQEVEIEEARERGRAVLEGDKPEIWSGKGKPSSEDRKATELLLQLRLSQKYDKLFSDKKTIKINIWNRIGLEIISAGFSLKEKDVGKRCYQKFLNLTKQYINFRKNAEKTGIDKKDPPDFNDLLDAILRDKHKVNIQNIEDSLPVDGGETISIENPADNFPATIQHSFQHNPLQERVDNSDNILAEADHLQEGKASSSVCEVPLDNPKDLPVTHGKKVKSSVRPVKTDKQELIRVITNKHKENIAQFKCFEEQIKNQNKLMEKQTDQRERMISILEKLSESKYEKKSRKRRHSSSSESEG